MNPLESESRRSVFSEQAPDLPEELRGPAASACAAGEARAYRFRRVFEGIEWRFLRDAFLSTGRRPDA